MNREGCAENLRQIGQGILLYANDHGGAFPDSFQTILADENVLPICFVCPATSDARASGPTTRAVAQDLVGGGHLSYVYVGRELTNNTSDAKTVVVFEPFSNHGNGMNVLFGDGHVEFVDANRGARIAAEAAAGVRPIVIRQ